MRMAATNPLFFKPPRALAASHAIPAIVEKNGAHLQISGYAFCFCQIAGPDRAVSQSRYHWPSGLPRLPFLPRLWQNRTKGLFRHYVHARIDVHKHGGSKKNPPRSSFRLRNKTVRPCQSPAALAFYFASCVSSMTGPHRGLVAGCRVSMLLCARQFCRLVFAYSFL